MIITTFDTLKFARRLKEAGVPEKQAEAEADAIREAFAEALDNQVATKSDIARLEVRMAINEKLMWSVLFGIIGLFIKSFF